ncbi:MAG: DUF983 domain-containing protein [Putridiphycobacter sp.]|nr:DUF983 domain-containing protein [Putridiphycobacter sp.]
MLESTKGSKLYSILNQKCPICQEGDYYLSKKAYNLKQFDKAHEHCSYCNHKFEIENGFFYGAMYVSYGLSVAFAVSFFMATYVLFPATPYYYYIFIIIIGLVVTMPISFRYSRLIWMNLFASYGKKEIFNK